MDKERMERIKDRVNRAQLGINDWQCSGEEYYLEQAMAELECAKAIITAGKGITETKSIVAYGVPEYNADLHDTPEEALEEIKCLFKRGERIELSKYVLSTWRPGIDVADLIEGFVAQADDEAGECTESYCDYLESDALKNAKLDLEAELNNVLNRWLDKNDIEAGWYDCKGTEGEYEFDGEKFVRIGGGE